MSTSKVSSNNLNYYPLNDKVKNQPTIYSKTKTNEFCSCTISCNVTILECRKARSNDAKMKIEIKRVILQMISSSLFISFNS